MAETSKGMMEKLSSGSAWLLPGMIFIVLGVTIVVEPGALIPVLITGFVLLLMMANVLRKKGRRSRDV